jgi:dTDP-glucose pyrophosphorylase/CBS domain-containing protein
VEAEASGVVTIQLIEGFYPLSEFMTVDLKSLCVPADKPIREIVATIDRSGCGIALVTDQDGHLLNTVTDGDVRRALLANQNLNAPVSELLALMKKWSYPRPITAQAGTESAVLLRLMQENVVRQIPLLDENGRLVDLITLDALLPDQVLPLQAVIMAGGSGTRLRPFTEDVPKPMLKVGDRPLMELMVEQLRQVGIRRVNITTFHKSDKITEHFGDGSNFGVEMNYVTEDRPLGTAGALGLMEEPQEPVLVINGDILTRVNFRAMLAYHQEHEAVLTMAVRKYDLNVPYGVVEGDGAMVRAVVEKPLLNFLVNAGIYLLEPLAYRYIPNGQHFHMTDLIQRLLDEGHRVVSFPILEYWLDIGNHIDYEQAHEDVKKGVFAS